MSKYKILGPYEKKIEGQSSIRVFEINIDNRSIGSIQIQLVESRQLPEIKKKYSEFIEEFETQIFSVFGNLFYKLYKSNFSKLGITISSDSKSAFTFEFFGSYSSNEVNFEEIARSFLSQVAPYNEGLKEFEKLVAQDKKTDLQHNSRAFYDSRVNYELSVTK
ncbi:MAG: hypothetical protein J0H68_00245 [Sphingobacteriia bacterium]|nr:hypothetical protein [Sphingobacteriia bacterium]